MLRQFSNRKYKRLIRRSQLYLEQLEQRQLLAADLLSMTSHQMPLWAESDSACVSIPGLLSRASDTSSQSGATAILAAATSSAHATEATQELWVAPGNDNDTDRWVSTANGEAGFVFGVPADMTGFVRATIVAIARNSTSSKFGISISVAKAGEDQNSSVTELTNQGPINLIQDQLIEIDISTAIPSGLEAGHDNVAVEFEAVKKSDLRVIGLRFFYDGLAGQVGPVGPPGPQGPEGVAGPQGPIGPQGPQGVAGPQGPAGADGAEGPEGPAGPMGPIGPQGQTGAQGPAGADGASGPQGPAGVQGPAGADGAQGPQGPAGATGAQGPAGATGAQGPQGPVGPMGPIGPQGPTGAQGADGKDGAQGPVGATGAQGAQGPVGATGAQGAQGPVGATGAQGPQGPVGATGATGSPGPSGPVGATGSPGPAGATGASGPQGPQGQVGPQGPAGIVGNEYAAGYAGATLADTLGLYAFLGPSVSVTIGVGNRIHVSGVAALGSTAVGGATLDSFSACHQPSGGGALVDGGDFLGGLSVPQNIRLPMGVSQRISGLAAGTYNVGLCYQANAAQAPKWNSNSWVNTHVLVTQS